MLLNPSKNSRTRKFNRLFLFHRYISGKIFMKIRSLVFTWSCYQTNRKTDKCWIKHNLVGRVIMACRRVFATSLSAEWRLMCDVHSNMHFELISEDCQFLLWCDVGLIRCSEMLWMSLIEMKAKESTSESKVDKAVPASGTSGIVELLLKLYLSVVLMSHCLVFLPLPRRLCNAWHLSVCLLLAEIRLAGWSVAFVCLCVCLITLYRSQFNSDFQHTSHTGRHQSGEELIKFRISSTPDLDSGLFWRIR